MDRAMLEAHLAQADRHVEQGEVILANQRRLIQELERDGHDTADACALLVQFEEVQALHVADRDRLWAELAGGADRLL